MRACMYLHYTIGKCISGMLGYGCAVSVSMYSVNCELFQFDILNDCLLIDLDWCDLA